MSFLKDIDLDKLIKSADIIAHGSVSAAGGYVACTYLAGKSVIKMGVLIAAGANPATAALAALVGTAASLVFFNVF